MGTWGSGPFDNDSAADYVEQLTGLPTPQSRAEAIAMTLKDALAAQLRPTDLRVYALGWRLEEALAAAAFIADAHRSVVRFTDSVYARAMSDDEQLLDPPDIGRPSPDLVSLAFSVLLKVFSYMKDNRAESEQLELVNAMAEALLEPVEGTEC